MTKWSNTFYAKIDIPVFAGCHIGVHVQADSMGEAVEAVSRTMEDMLTPEMYVKHVITRIERLDWEDVELLDSASNGD